MRIVVVDGAGEVGAELVRDLARVEDIDSLVVADTNGVRARDIAADGDSPRVRACELDVHDREAPSPAWWFPYERPAIDEGEISGAKASPV